jgi:hypothetical protein
MKHCHGSLEFLPGVYTQGDCGSAGPRCEHPYTPEADR